MKLTLSQEEDIAIEVNNIIVVIKHNDVGISVDYYPNIEDDPQPFREDQVWWDDIPKEFLHDTRDG